MMQHVMTTYGRQAIAFSKGEGSWLWDLDGRRYLDGVSGVAVNGLGHAHPRLMKAIAEQVARAMHVSNLFEIPAIALLPDHLHTLWELPPGDSSYSMRWRRIKEEFTERFLFEGGEEGLRSGSRELRKERGVWQRRFWEHTVLDEGDFERHCDYIHYNPVKHGLVACPGDWAYSSFQRWVRRDVYPEDWGCSSHDPPINLDVLNDTAME